MGHRSPSSSHCLQLLKKDGTPQLRLARSGAWSLEARRTSGRLHPLSQSGSSVPWMMMMTPSANVCSRVYTDIESPARAGPMRRSCRLRRHYLAARCGDVDINGEVACVLPFLHLQHVFAQVVAAVPCDSPPWRLLFGNDETPAVFRFRQVAPNWNAAWQAARKSIFPNFFEKKKLTPARPRSRHAAELKSPTMKSALLFSAILRSWPKSCFATSRLLAAMRLRRAETKARWNELQQRLRRGRQ